MQNQYDLDMPLINFSDAQGSSFWTLREACEGCQIFGSNGSGKSSGSAKLIASKFLSNGFGGLVLTAKKEEKKTWEQYCRDAGRLDDLVVLEPRGKYRFNFIEYESTARNGEKAITENIAQVLKTIIRAGEEKGSGKSDDPFWEDALDMLIFNVIDLCILAYGTVSVKMMHDIVVSAPKVNVPLKLSGDHTERKDAFTAAFEKAQDNINSQVDAWEATFTKEQIEQMEADGNYEENLLEAVEDVRTMQFVDQFFIETYRNLSDKTRSIILLSFSGFLFRLLKEPVYSLFCKGKSTVVPEDCLQGKIILVNLPVKEYHKVGRDCQVLFKYIFQRAMERRDVEENDRPMFLYADEAQSFLHEYDPEYQATARSSRIATVYISQNLHTYYSNMGGGEKSEHKVKSFLGTLGTKVFHSSSDVETNQYASSLFGEAYVEDITASTTVAGKFSSTRAKSYKLERMVRPEQFVGLRHGGKFNLFLIDAYMHRQHQAFPDGFNFKKVTFKQN